MMVWNYLVIGEASEDVRDRWVPGRSTLLCMETAPSHVSSSVSEDGACFSYDLELDSQAQRPHV